ncbi:C4-dicarboxylate ABC transporter substrate-binding protein, partial [Streptomyces sp. NWU339]
MLAVGACGATAEKKETGKSDEPVTGLRIMVPN